MWTLINIAHSPLTPAVDAYTLRRRESASRAYDRSRDANFHKGPRWVLYEHIRRACHRIEHRTRSRLALGVGSYKRASSAFDSHEVSRILDANLCTDLHIAPRPAALPARPAL